MLNRLRRSRGAVLVLLVGSPALGGTVLPVVHPCPVDAPWLSGETSKATTHQLSFGPFPVTVP